MESCHSIHKERTAPFLQSVARQPYVTMKGVAPDVAKRLSEARLRITMNVIYTGGDMPINDKVKEDL